MKSFWLVLGVALLCLTFFLYTHNDISFQSQIQACGAYQYYDETNYFRCVSSAQGDHNFSKWLMLISGVSGVSILFLLYKSTKVTVGRNVYAVPSSQIPAVAVTKKPEPIHKVTEELISVHSMALMQKDKRFQESVRIVRRTGKIGPKFLMDRLSLRQKEAEDYILIMEKLGYVSGIQKNGKRKVLIE